MNVFEQTVCGDDLQGVAFWCDDCGIIADAKMYKIGRGRHPSANSRDERVLAAEGAELIEQRDGMIVLALPHTDYRLHLAVEGPVEASPQKLVTGRIYAEARRMDRVVHGGRYIEPRRGMSCRGGFNVGSVAGRGTLHDHGLHRDASPIVPARPDSGQGGRASQR